MTERSPSATVSVSPGSDAPTRTPANLGTLLVERGHLRPSDLERALTAQRRTGERLGEALVRLGLAREENVAVALATQLGLPSRTVPLEPETAATRLISAAFARARAVVPLDCTGRTLRVAVADPLDLATVDDLQFQSGRRVRVVVTTRTRIREGLEVAYEAEVAEIARELPEGPSGTASPAGPSLAATSSDAPLVRLVDLLLRRSIDERASDLHLEQGRDELVVRQRVDGILTRVTELPPASRAALVSRIKVMAGMDISIRRKPQDGGFSFPYGDRRLNVRVSTLPVERGEKVVLRILDPRATPSGLNELGFSDRDLDRLRELVAVGSGVVLASGPTGSGKSSTLFGAMTELDRDAMNLVTLEDPIEYRVPGVSQVQVRPRAGLGFPTVLRSVLRQDPDVIMVGEIRDRETAEIAMSAAITGHLVLSTLHTIDAPSAIIRLLQMGVQPHLVAGGLTGVVAQRLVRKSCSGCGGEPTGCGDCKGGYRGRTGIFQVLAVSDQLRSAIAQRADAGEIRRLAGRAGMGTMAADARRKVAERITTQHEVSRVLSESPSHIRSCRRCGTTLPDDAAGCPGCGAPSARICSCGRGLRRPWRFCPHCLRRAPPSTG
ncbi:MAG: ATPase, T2SS/T4P/T4SS family [Gemmatimonadota bacterium]